MDENRLSGTAKKLGGKVEEGLGRVTGDAKTQAEGRLKQAEGSIQDLYGQAINFGRGHYRIGQDDRHLCRRYDTRFHRKQALYDCCHRTRSWLAYRRSHRPF